LAEKAAKVLEGNDWTGLRVLFARALALAETAFDAHDPELAPLLANYAVYKKAEEDFAGARALHTRALAIVERTEGPSSLDMATLLFNLAQLDKAEAESLEARAAQIERDDAEVARDLPRVRRKLRHDLARWKLEVGPSRIHRFGLFARETIPAGERVIEYTGERIGRREAVRRWKTERMYLFRLDSYLRIDGSVGGSGAELVNHCCDPNCRFRVEDGHVFIVTLRELVRGEELLLDYAFASDSERIPCHCGAPRCRGTINSTVTLREKRRRANRRVAKDR
jgi:hypothetical protein